MSETVFADGFILKAPHENAPKFIKGSLSVKVDEAIKFLEDNKDARGWVNLDLKVGQSGKWYVQRNEWKPEPKEEGAPAYPEEEINPEDVPF